MSDCEIEYTVPFKVKRTPLKRCEECFKKKLTSTLYEIYDTGLNYYIEAVVCNKCVREARKRARNE